MPKYLFSIVNYTHFVWTFDLVVVKNDIIIYPHINKHHCRWYLKN